MYISVFESRSDWKDIVEAVDCPMVVKQNGATVVRCGAKAGEPCHPVSAAVGTLFASRPRLDWHQERKEAAILAWRAARKEVSEESIPAPTAAGASAYTPRGISVPAPSQQQFIQIAQEAMQEVDHAFEERKIEEGSVGEHQGDEEIGASDETGSGSQPEEGGQIKVQITNNEADRG